MKITRLRRIVLLIIVGLFLSQFLGVKALVGGLSGSVAVWFVKLIDVFAWMESLAASQSFTMTAFWAVLPLAVVYLVVGRAFCGWVCPMDYLFELVNRLRGWKRLSFNVPPSVGYGIAALFIIASVVVEIPVFTNYLSHLTNFFRLLTGGLFLALDLPVERSVVLYSGAIIAGLLVLEAMLPRLWCRVLCPVGKLYGIFNKISLLRLSFAEGKCARCNICDQVCYMGVEIARHADEEGLRDSNCIYCGRCVEGCETRGKLVKMTFRRK
ncbi:MAG TPA: 4Fe-4S binding protein [Dissulfurispiraceae bacterium]|nr:4Fe-4S binding protein [Dissulfurispiraceae bacterium]